jgi:hypothetical protein
MLLVISIPAVGQSENQNNSNEKSFEIFLNCYIEIINHGEYTSRRTNPAFGIGLWIWGNKDSEIKIYSDKDGDLLLHHVGEHHIRIAIFRGFTESTEDISLMYGKAFFVRVIVL